MSLQTETQRLKNQVMAGGADDRGESRSGGFVDSLRGRFRRWGDFLHDVRVELRQVTWPTRHEVLTTTFVVIVAVAFFGLFFFGVDSTVGYVVQRIFSFFKAS